MSKSDPVSSGNHSTECDVEEGLPLLIALYPVRWSPPTIAAAAQVKGRRTLNAWRRGLDEMEEAIARAVDGVPMRRAN